MAFTGELSSTPLAVFHGFSQPEGHSPPRSDRKTVGTIG
jgi:hypothetical protein